MRGMYCDIRSDTALYILVPRFFEGKLGEGVGFKGEGERGGLRQLLCHVLNL